jgi:hypothetical protein
MIGHNRMVFAENIQYTDEGLKALIVSENADGNSPESQKGEIKLTFNGCIDVGLDDLEVQLSSSSLLLQGSDVPGVVCKASDGTNVVRANQLLKHLLKMFSLPNKPVFSPEVRREGRGESDSGDEDVPIDREIPSVFNDRDIAVVQNQSNAVWNNYKRSRESSFSSGPGKLFMTYLGQLLSLVIDAKGRYESSLTTCAGGSGAASNNDMQAGSCIVTYLTSRRETRNSSSSQQLWQCSSGNRRFSDVSTYDHEKEMYIIVGEVKSVEDVALSQNLEQMMGLWRAKQKFMLGWTINPANVCARLLVRQDNDITLYNATLPNRYTALLHLSRLYLAVFLFVET